MTGEQRGADGCPYWGIKRGNGVKAIAKKKEAGMERVNEQTGQTNDEVQTKTKEGAMRKAMGLVVSLGVMLLSLIGPVKAWADTLTDTFQITITVNFLSIDLKDRAGAGYTTWAVGQVATSSTNLMDSNSGAAGDEGILVDNTSNEAVDLFCYATNTASWTLGSSVGSDQCVLKAKAFTGWQASPNPDMGSAVTVTSTSAPGEEVQDNLAASTDSYFYYSLQAPSVCTTGGENTFTVTVRVAAHS